MFYHDDDDDDVQFFVNVAPCQISGVVFFLISLYFT